MRLFLRIGMVAGLLHGPAFAGDNLVGAAQCGKCHPAEFQKQSHSHHALALSPIAQSPLAAKLAGHSVRERNGLEFKYTAVPNGIGVTAERGSEHASAVLEWAFGAGVRGITPVGEIGHRYFEHRVSWYADHDRAGLTVGHPKDPPSSAAAALGQVQPVDVIYRCFNCHATGVKSGPDLSALRAGVECERCHGPGAAHVRQPSRSNIVNPGRASPTALVRSCGQCHRLPATANIAAEPEVDDPESVRFAPVGLMASRCFRESGNLSCLGCHDPHSDVNRDARFYTERCLDCHANTAATTGQHCRRAARENCLPCHMPKSTPMPMLEFTDHRIRILEGLLQPDRISWEPVESALLAGDYTAARRGLELLPSNNVKWHLLASRIYDAQRDPAQAVAQALAAIAVDARSLAAYLQLGQIFLTYNTPEPAVEIFSKALQIAPGSLVAHLGAGLAWKGTRQYDRAEKELTECLKRDPRMSAAFDALVSLYLETLDYEKLASAAQQYLEMNPSDYRGYYYLATAQEQAQEDIAGAERLLRRALQLNPNFAASYALLGKILLKEGHAAEAIQELERSIRLRPDYVTAHFYLSNAYKKAGRDTDAAQELREVRELNDKQVSPPILMYHRATPEK